MLLAVAGLNQEAVEKRTQKLASGDWTAFSPVEQLAFQFGYKMTREPWKVSQAEVQRLVEVFGKHRAVDLIWYSAWCNYMTRVADAFQFPLERENVFMPAAADKRK